MILAKCARKTRVHHVSSLTDEAGLAFTLGLTVLPKAAHMATYSLRARRGCNVKLLSGWPASCDRWADDRPGRVQLQLSRHPPPRRRRAHVEGVSGHSLSCLAARHGEITECGSNSPLARTPLSATY